MAIVALYCWNRAKIGQKHPEIARFWSKMTAKMAKLVTFMGKNEALEAVARRIAAREITKQQAAAELGISYDNLCARLKRAGLIDMCRTPRGGADSRRHDSPGMEAAVAEALALPDNDIPHGALAAIARRHGLTTQLEYVSLSTRVSHRRRSRIKADLEHAAKDQAAGAAQPG